MTVEQICDRLDRIERADHNTIRSEIAALRLDIEIDIRRAADAARATKPVQEKRIA